MVFAQVIGKRLFKGVGCIHDGVAFVVHQVDFDGSVVRGVNCKGDVAFVDHEEGRCCVPYAVEGLGRNAVDLLGEGKVCFPVAGCVDGQGWLCISQKCVGPDPAFCGLRGCCNCVRILSGDADAGLFGLNSELCYFSGGLGEGYGVDPGRKFSCDTVVSGA